MGTIGERIRQIRKSRNITGTELEKRTGISSEYINKIEKNHLKNITYFTMLKISEGLGISINELLAEKLIPEFPELRFITPDNPAYYINWNNRIEVVPILFMTNENRKYSSNPNQNKIKNSETIFISSSWLKGVKDYNQCRCIKLSKYCRMMLPIIEPESIICIDLKQNDPNVLEGKIVAGLVEDEIFIGYLRKGNEHYILLPENLKEYNPNIIFPAKGNIILGKIMWLFKSLNDK